MVYLLDKHIFLLRTWKVFQMLYTFVLNETFLTLLQDYFKHLWPSWITSTTFNSKVWRYDHASSVLKFRQHNETTILEDYSHACLKKDQVDAFHQNLNSINANIQFTLELKDTNEYGLPFLHTIMWRRGTAWTFTGSQHIQSATLIFSLTTPHARKDQWLTRYYFVQETFHAQVKANGRRGDEEKRCFERTTTHLALSMNVKEGNKIS